ncbi:DUF6545 domain-containing protein [Streptomyces sirii]|uniref:DUF6545 domain-containing protein n=1 Tax=Streptomyces sirii TaxID=3127701 RepID=UPI003D36EB0B
METRLYRLIIEIRDGQRSLRPHLDEVGARLALRVARQAAVRRTEPEAMREACAPASAVPVRDRGLREERDTPARRRPRNRTARDPITGALTPGQSHGLDAGPRSPIRSRHNRRHGWR